MVQSEITNYLALFSRQVSEDFSILEILKEVEPIDINNKELLFVFCQRDMGFYRKLYIYLAQILSKNGFPSIFLFKDNFLSQYIPKNLFTVINHKYGLELINSIFKNFEIVSHFPRLKMDGIELSTSLTEEVSKIKIKNDEINQEFQHDWNIDYDNELIIAQGINFFPLIQNTLRTCQKRYTLNFNNNKIKSITEDMIKTCDLLLMYTEKLKKFSYENNIKIRMIGWESTYIPNGAFRICCDHLSEDRDIEYIALQRGYAHYFGHKHRESYVVECNLTSTGFDNRKEVSKEEINKITRDIDEKTLFNEINEIIKKPKSKDFTKKQEKVINYIKKKKINGNKIFVLLAHLFYDTPLDDSSSSFKDMGDWILNTIEYFKKNDDVLLLKPHWAEIRPDYPNKEPNETLSSFLKNKNINLPKNIILLEPRLFGLNELIEFIDCGLIWRSSAALELPYYNIPCIVAGTPTYKIIEFHYPKNKSNYFEMIEKSEKLDISKEMKIGAGSYILALKRKHRYIGIFSYNNSLKKNYINKKKLQYSLKNPDENIRYLIERIIE